MHNPEKVWDRFAKGYNKKPVSNEAVYQEKLDRTRKFLTPGAHVLELGCGTGTTAVAHAPNVKHIDAIDASGKMLAFGHEKAMAAGVENITFTQTDITTFKADNNSYDVVLGLSILHLLEDKEAMIAKVHAMLKPGGVFITSTVVMKKKQRLLSAILSVGKAVGLLPLVRFFTTENLVQAMESAGFEIEQNWQAKGADSVFLTARKPA